LKTFLNDDPSGQEGTTMIPSSAALVFICSSLVDASELSYALSDDEIWDGKVEGSDICLWWPLCSVG
jgi:hypothetical protein